MNGIMVAQTLLIVRTIYNQSPSKKVRNLESLLNVTAGQRNYRSLLDLFYN